MSVSEPLGVLYPAASAAVLSFILTGLAAWYARKSGLLDHPGERHSHKEATPRGGGAGLVAAFFIASLVVAGPETPDAWMHGILPGMLFIAFLGAWDDHRSLSVRFRLFVQLAVSIGFIWYASSTGWFGAAIAVVLGGIFLVWMINMYNFMDGSNGMAAMQGVFGGLVLALLFHRSGMFFFSSLSVLLAASCIGFLPWNLGRARVFMGDVGSLALGFVFAALLLYGVGTGAFGIPVALMVMLVFLTDSTLTLLTRVIRREQWYNPHRQHLYQRLIAHGWSHLGVAALYQFVNLALVFPAMVIAVKYPVFAWVAAMASIIICVLGWYLLVRRFEVLARAG